MISEDSVARDKRLIGHDISGSHGSEYHDYGFLVGDAM